ncbi:MAG: hypothetical protein ABI766_14785 [Gemmatimonadales bacterium]
MVMLPEACTLRGRVAVARCFLPLAMASHLVAQNPPAAAIDWWSEDSTRIAFVRAHGQPRTYPHVVIWSPSDSLDPRWLPSFEDSLAAGLDALRALIGTPRPWQRIGNRPVVIILSPGRFISHATGQDTVLIALVHVRKGWAPFLHEAAHELLAPPAPFSPYEYADTLVGEQKAAVFPFWLSEGLPDYLAQSVVQTTGFREGDVFEIGGLGKVDSTCRVRLSGHPRRGAIAARIGGQGRLEALYTTEREQVAPTYYACSQSFTKYLASRIGLSAVVELMPAIPSGHWLAQLETRAGAALPVLRREWLAALNIPDDFPP